MGDRGNIVVFTDKNKPPLVMYTHWGGTEIAKVVANVVKKQARWEDPPYFARMIFSELTNGDTGETGFGLSVNYICDNEHQLVIVDIPNNKVFFLDELPDSQYPLESWTPKRKFTFKEITENKFEFLNYFDCIDS